MSDLEELIARAVRDTLADLRRDPSLISDVPAALDVPGAASYCGVGRSKFEARRRAGGGPAWYRDGRAIRFSRVDLDRWIAAQPRERGTK